MAYFNTRSSNFKRRRNPRQTPETIVSGPNILLGLKCFNLKEELSLAELSKRYGLTY